MQGVKGKRPMGARNEGMRTQNAWVNEDIGAKGTKGIMNKGEELVLVKNDMRAFCLPAPAGFETLLTYWEHETGSRAVECAHEACHRPATQGGVATTAFSTDRRRMVYPCCETCARRTEMLYVKGPFAYLDK